MRTHLRALSFALFGLASPAEAMCLYGAYPDGLNAATTIDQEFYDSTVVVRGTVLRSDRKTLSTGSAREQGVLYQVRSDEIFKGQVPLRFAYFTALSSDALQLEDGTQYLLFLNPLPLDDPDEDVAPGALVVNYSCGQSGPWADIPPDGRHLLRQLSGNGRGASAQGAK